MSVPTVHPLHPRQLAAVAPEETVWLSASAGTGKTQVLSARVLRLLLQPGVEPGQLLCLTFTKAGAAEMSARIADKLAGWVRLDDTSLARELQAIGADIGPATLARARTLFAAVLDCPGGGLRIDTIHAFAQWLLGAFPQEAGLTPGSRPMEDREKVLLARQVLADVLLAAETERPDLIDAAEELSLRLGASGVEAFLMRCAEARGAWFGPGSWQEPLRDRVLALLDLPAHADATWLAALCSDAVFDRGSLELCLSAYRQWNGIKGMAGRDVIADWLASEPAARFAAFDDLFKVLFTQKDTIKDAKSLSKFEEFFEQAAETVLGAMIAVRERAALLNLAERMVPALTLGRAFALAWDAAKEREGLVDFDDQIRRAAALLKNADYAQWIGYKLDRQFDHILVDEAQDTNAAQWAIIDALTREFFAGRGQRDDVLRTLFVVGDYKQAIFRFQGTSPENFEAARERVHRQMQGAAENAAALGRNEQVRDLRRLGLGQSFRTAQPVLDFVDRAIAAIGHEAFGLDQPAEAHSGLPLPGQVTLWQPVGLRREEADEDEPVEDDGGEETWLPKPERDMAEGIARQVRHWVDHGFPLVKGRKPGQPPRAATAGDVMVLVRKRGDLAALIVARLHAHGVPVAGVDRLRLGAPLAVRDLVAALRFAAQPLDDLNLACLLGSPLIGWSQEALLEHGYRDRKVPLWTHLRRSRHPQVAAVLAQLGDLLGQADYEPPQALLHWLLVGPWDGRRKLVARLGREANDPIDELLNAAHAYAATATPSLVGFLQWFDAGEGELKREADNAGGLVRVMTVHGAKGLQAPIVILADATGDPDRNRGSAPALPDRHEAERRIPLPGLTKEETVGVVAEHIAMEKTAEEQEHWRLLYVAMTRAEEALFVGGALLSRDRGEVPQKSWYANLQALFGTEPDWRDDPLWGKQLVHGGAAAEPVERSADAAVKAPEPLPAWIEQPPPAEPRPPRPLAPSSLGEDLATDPPLPPGSGQAAARGVLLHKLLERLPELPPVEREAAAEAWLARNGAEFSAADRAEMTGSALAVLAEPAWADLFAPGALAEVPIAATVGGQVVVGTIDRLTIRPDRIRLVDFKTARRPPENLDAVPVSILRQMAAYAAALEATYPGRPVEAALLYTQIPRLIVLPDELLSVHKQALLAAQESF